MWHSQLSLLSLYHYIVQCEALASSTVKCWVYSVYAGVWGPHKVRYLQRLMVKWWCLPDGGWLGSAQILHNHLMGMGVNVQGVYALRGAYLWDSKAYFQVVHSKRGLSKGVGVQHVGGIQS